jgi:hypothetical protein
MAYYNGHNFPVVESAAQAFADSTGIEITVHAPKRGEDFDATIHFKIRSTNAVTRDARYFDTVDRYATLARFKDAAGGRIPDARVLVAPYLSPNLVAKARELELDAIDLSGNGVVQHKSSLIMVTGRPRAPGVVARSTTWTRAAMRVILALIVHPGLLCLGYRAIAQQADVSRGTVQNTFQSLLQRRDIVKRAGDNYAFTDQNRLLDDWVTLYPSLLRDSLVLGRYRAAVKDWWRDIDLLKEDCQFGGEVAAAEMTNYLKPAVVTLYCEGAVPRTLISHGKLRPDPQGDVEFLRAPIPLDKHVSPNITYPALVYADLLASGDSRNLETARIVREKYIATA